MLVAIIYLLALQNAILFSNSENMEYKIEEEHKYNV